MSKKPHKPSAGQRIIKGLQDAAAGNFSAVMIEGQHWMRTGFVSIADRELYELRRPPQLRLAVRQRLGDRAEIEIDWRGKWDKKY